MIRTAFTILELVVVIVIISILTITVIPSFQRDQLAEAAQQLVSHLQYTKHLAMVDNKFDPQDKEWYKARWQIFFTKSLGADEHWSYTVFSDSAGKHTGNPDLSEVAINPMNSDKLLTGGYSGTRITQYDGDQATNELNIGHEYNIEDIIFTGGCEVVQSRLRISFDYFGRPMYDSLHRYDGMYEKNGKNMLVKQQCQITLCLNTCSAAGIDEKISIAIEPETGYIHIL